MPSFVGTQSPCGAGAGTGVTGVGAGVAGAGGSGAGGEGARGVGAGVEDTAMQKGMGHTPFMPSSSQYLM